MRTGRVLLLRSWLALTLILAGSWCLVSCGATETRGESVVSRQSEDSPTPTPAREEEAEGEVIPECPAPAVFEESKAIETALPTYQSVRKDCDRFRPPVVRFVVSMSGGVTNYHFLSGTGCEASDQLILSYIRKWRYEPATCDGEPIAQEVIFTARWGN